MKKPLGLDFHVQNRSIASLQHSEDTPLYLLKPLFGLDYQICEVGCLLILFLPLSQGLVVLGFAHKFTRLSQSLIVDEIDVGVRVIAALVLHPLSVLFELAINERVVYFPLVAKS